MDRSIVERTSKCLPGTNSVEFILIVTKPYEYSNLEIWCNHYKFTPHEYVSEYVKMYDLNETNWNVK